MPPSNATHINSAEKRLIIVDAAFRLELIDRSLRRRATAKGSSKHAIKTQNFSGLRSASSTRSTIQYGRSRWPRVLGSSIRTHPKRNSATANNLQNNPLFLSHSMLALNPTDATNHATPCASPDPANDERFLQAAITPSGNEPLRTESL
jgi:hypothetical protein